MTKSAEVLGSGFLALFSYFLYNPIIYLFIFFSKYWFYLRFEPLSLRFFVCYFYFTVQFMKPLYNCQVRMLPQVRATTLACGKFCKIEKVTLFTYFGKKNTHISGYKIVHLCTIAIITVHICTITIACAFIILLVFSLSLSLLLSLSPHSPSHLTLR